MTKDSLGDRMKDYYENAFKHKLPMRMPVIMRVDGKAFHSFTRGFAAFDTYFIKSMQRTAQYLWKNIATAQIAYVQSDEISLLLHNYKRLETQAWFDNELQKLCSITAGYASSFMSLEYSRPAIFDCRAFVLPEAEVTNYFLWRQQDATRNSVQMLAQSMHSHKELHKKNNSELQEMCFQKGANWNDLPTTHRRGSCIVKVPMPNPYVLDGNRMEWAIDDEIPIFSADRNYIDRHLQVD